MIKDDTITNDDISPDADIDGGKLSARWTKYTLSHTDFQDAATFNSQTLFSTAAGEVIEAVIVNHTTAFSGGSISAYTLEIGIFGYEDKYLAASDVLQAAPVAAPSSLLGLESVLGSTSVLITARSISDNLDQSSAGDVDVYVKTSTIP